MVTFNHDNDDANTTKSKNHNTNKKKKDVQSFLAGLQKKHYDTVVMMNEKKIKNNHTNDNDDDTKKNIDKSNNNDNNKRNSSRKRKMDHQTTTSSSSSSSNNTRDKVAISNTVRTTTSSSNNNDHTMNQSGESQQQEPNHNYFDDLPRYEVSRTSNHFVPPHRYILAPMVGASELPFRLLCRKYGVELAYTPMLDAEKFVKDATYRNQEMFEKYCVADRPLVIHFGCSNIQHFVQATLLAKELYNVDAIDLNLGCPQRTAYIGHYGSYLLDPMDRKLICQMIYEARIAVNGTIPIFCKIRLLQNQTDTLQLIRHLRDAGASLIAIHARYRASYERKGPGARDGPALLNQVQHIVNEIKKDRDTTEQQQQQQGSGSSSNGSCNNDIKIITNGNTITYEDVIQNLQYTNANGCMSAEGLLDHPALFLPRYGSREERTKQIKVWTLVKKKMTNMDDQKNKNRTSYNQKTVDVSISNNIDPIKQQQQQMKIDKLKKKLTKMDALQQKGIDTLTDQEKEKLISLTKKQKKLDQLLLEQQQQNEEQITNSSSSSSSSIGGIPNHDIFEMKQIFVSLGSLYDQADNKIHLALEYLDLVTVYPVKIRSVIFHIRRMMKDLLIQYQLLEDCINWQTLMEVRTIVLLIDEYEKKSKIFIYDHDKATNEKKKMELKKVEDNKRIEYEARMIRKAKREKKTDIYYYLQMGAILPTIQELQTYQKELTKEQQIQIWKEKHSQHCMNYHLNQTTTGGGGCSRGRQCAFLHVDIVGSTTNGGNNNSQFIESDEVAG